MMAVNANLVWEGTISPLGARNRSRALSPVSTSASSAHSNAPGRKVDCRLTSRLSQASTRTVACNPAESASCDVLDFDLTERGGRWAMAGGTYHPLANNHIDSLDW